MTNEEAIEYLEDAKIKFKIPKAAVTARKTNEALDIAIKALESKPKTQYENYLKKSEVVISQLRADRDRLLGALDEIRAEIEKLQTYKMFVGEKTVYVERDDVLAIIDKHRGESEGTDAGSY